MGVAYMGYVTLSVRAGGGRTSGQGKIVRTESDFGLCFIKSSHMAQRMNVFYFLYQKLLIFDQIVEVV